MHAFLSRKFVRITGRRSTLEALVRARLRARAYPALDVDELLRDLDADRR